MQFNRLPKILWHIHTDIVHDYYSIPCKTEHQQQFHFLKTLSHCNICEGRSNCRSGEHLQKDCGRSVHLVHDYCSFFCKTEHRRQFHFIKTFSYCNIREGRSNCRSGEHLQKDCGRSVHLVHDYCSLFVKRSINGNFTYLRISRGADGPLSGPTNPLSSSSSMMEAARL